MLYDIFIGCGCDFDILLLHCYYILIYVFIGYILNLLQNAFFNAKLKRRSRRSSIERHMLLNAKKNRRNNNNIKKQTVGSAGIMNPTLERSLMTMSFLMFGVFVIQVVQVIKSITHYYIIMVLNTF